MEQSTLRLCIDKYLPGESPAENPDGDKLAAETDKMWKPGTTLKIRFLDGDPQVQARVIAAANEWCNYANVYFDFGDYDDAVIRISFTPGGSWSYIGRDAEEICSPKPTMNLGWLTTRTSDAEVRRVVLHEFGHALGCIHEHQNPDAGIQWNKDFVYAYYADTNKWDKRLVDRNLFQTYEKERTQFTAFDPTSIMVYPIMGQMTTDGFAVDWVYDLSSTDIEYIGLWYPFDKEREA